MVEFRPHRSHCACHGKSAKISSPVKLIPPENGPQTYHPPLGLRLGLGLGLGGCNQSIVRISMCGHLPGTDLLEKSPLGAEVLDASTHTDSSTRADDDLTILATGDITN